MINNLHRPDETANRSAPKVGVSAKQKSSRQQHWKGKAVSQKRKQNQDGALPTITHLWTATRQWIDVKYQDYWLPIQRTNRIPEEWDKPLQSFKRRISIGRCHKVHQCVTDTSEKRRHEDMPSFKKGGMYDNESHWIFAKRSTISTTGIFYWRKSGNLKPTIFVVELNLTAVWYFTWV